jgi:hypothetical protein
MKAEDIQKLFDNFAKEIDQTKANCLRLVWYMRGGLQYTDVMNMSSVERDMINKLIDENLETSKKSGLPFF